MRPLDKLAHHFATQINNTNSPHESGYWWGQVRSSEYRISMPEGWLVDKVKAALREIYGLDD